MDTIFKLGIVVSVLDKLTGPVKKMVQSVTTLEKTMSAGRGMVEFGQRMGLAAAVVSESAAKMRGAVGAIVEPIAGVDDAMAALRTVTTTTMGSIEKSMEAARAAAVDWSKDHVQSAEEFIRTSYMMASAGLNDVQAIAGTRAALRLATATMGDNMEAANLLATVYNNVGDKSRSAESELGRLGDILARTQQLFQMPTLNALTEGFKNAMPAAIQSRMRFEEVNVVLGMLNNAGLQGAVAGTAYAATLRQMNKASAELGFGIARAADGGLDFIGTLENITRKYGDLSRLSPQVQMKFQQAFGDEGLRAVMLLSGKLGDMKKALSDVSQAAGTAAQAQATMEATASKQYEVLRNNVTALKMEVGKGLVPALNDLIPSVRRTIDAVGAFATAHPGLTRTIVLVLALGAGVLTILAPVLSVVSGIAIMVGYGLMGFAKLGQAVIWFRHILASGKIVSAVNSIGRGFLTAFGWARTAVLQAVVGLKAFVLGMWAMAKQAAITAVTALPALIAKVWAFTAALWANPVTWVVAGIMLLVGAVVLLVRNWDTVKAAGIAAWNAIKGAVGGAVEAVAGWLGSIRNSAAEALKGALAWILSLVDTFREAGVSLWEAFVDGISSLVNKPLEVVRSGLSKLRALLPFSDAKEGPLSNLSKSGAALVGTLTAGVQRTMPALKEALASGLQSAWPALPEAALAGYAAPAVKVSVAAPAIDLSPLYRDRGARGDRRLDEKPIVINGDLHVHIEKVDREEDFLAMLRRLAEGAGVA